MIKHWLFCFGVIVCVFIAEVIIFLLFRKMTERHFEKLTNLYGERLSTPDFFPDFWFLDVVFNSIAEEVVFRGPIWILQKTNVPLIILIIACILSAAIFGLLHRRKKMIFERGTARLPWHIIFHMSLGGLLYGIALVLTRSFFVPLCCHIAWNSFGYWVQKAEEK